MLMLYQHGLKLRFIVMVTFTIKNLKMVLKILSENKDLTNAMFYESFMDRKSRLKTVSQDHSILESSLMRDVANNKVLQVVTRVDLFYNTIKELLIYKVDYPLHYNAIILIIGLTRSTVLQCR